ncbi:MAG TPA: TlpA disulfide reductase family protein [Chitinophagaceae bacterium]|nr:TlpA disulfide reductase family protein [Chitinophagaceae bacterium]
MKNSAIRSTATLFAFLIISMGALAQHKMVFTASGHIKGLPDGELYLAFGSFSHMKADTVTVTSGNFTFHDSIAEPCYGMLFNHNYTVKVDMFIDRGKIHITGNIDSAYDIRVSGSPVVNEYAAYNQSLLNTRKPVQVLYEQWMDAYKAGDSSSAKTYRSAFFTAKNKQGREAAIMQLDFIRKHPDSYASAWELLHYVNDKTLDTGRRLFAALSDRVKHSEQGKETGRRIATLSRVEVGNMAPGFEEKAVNDQPVTLLSYRGKYVLLEFWASWCGPCRAESPNVLKAYRKYKNDGFDVLSVSLDHEKDKWEEAIKKDGLLWTQVSDLKGWKNKVAVLYGIHAVPANFLIDPSGKIIAQDLRGVDLGNALKKIFAAK